MIRSVDTLQCYASYTVAKLKDGKCWMVDNLRIYGKTVDSTDTDMESGSFSIPNTPLSEFKGTSITSNQAYYYREKDGTYYTWYTVTAGSGDGNIVSNGQNAPYSICPKGWHLPTGGNTGHDEIDRLCSAYSNSISALYATPVPGLFADGQIMSGSFQEYGADGHWWSSTADSSSSALFLQTRSPSSCISYTGYPRYAGNTARCIAD